MIHEKAIEASRLADLLQQAALDLNRLTISLRGSPEVRPANEAFLAAASAAARAAELTGILSGHPAAAIEEAR
jgi:hypothetical protein